MMRFKLVAIPCSRMTSEKQRGMHTIEIVTEVVVLSPHGVTVTWKSTTFESERSLSAAASWSAISLANSVF
jgi:hypothetical protein